MLKQSCFHDQLLPSEYMGTCVNICFCQYLTNIYTNVQKFGVSYNNFFL